MSTFRRVLVAGDLHRDASAMLEEVARLATRLGAELAALYVEDLDLIHSAALPFTREIGLVTRGNLDAHEIAKTIERDAARVQQAIAAAATRLNVKWTFEVEQGRLLARALERAEGADFVFVGARQVASGPIVVLEDGEHVAEHLRESLPGTHLVVLPAGELQRALRELRPSLVVVQIALARTLAPELASVLRTSACGIVLTG